jgi:hypothetical protein
MVVRLHSDGDPAAEEDKHAQEQCECLSVPTAPSAAVSTHIEVGSKATSYQYTLQGTNTTSEHNKGRTKGPLSSFIACLSSHQRSIIVRSNFREALIVIMFPLSHTHTHTHTRTHTAVTVLTVRPICPLQPWTLFHNRRDTPHSNIPRGNIHPTQLTVWCVLYWYWTGLLCG